MLDFVAVLFLMLKLFFVSLIMCYSLQITFFQKWMKLSWNSLQIYYFYPLEV